MNRMDDLRKRRRERIQHILNGEQDVRSGWPEEEWSSRIKHERKLMEDPEYEWRYRGNPWRASTSSRTAHAIRLQIVLSIILFAAVWALFQWKHPAVAQGQAFVRSALTEEMHLEDMYARIKERIGELPSFIPAWDRTTQKAEQAGAGVSRAYIAPVTGSVVEPFGGVRSGAGIVIRSTGASVASMDAGLVIYAGETLETGQTVVVRHPNGVETVYGYLGEISVTRHDWVEAGAAIGQVRPAAGGAGGGILYFAVKKGNSFIDPTDVVAL